MNRIQKLLDLHRRVEGIDAQRRQAAKQEIIRQELRSDWLSLNGFNEGRDFKLTTLMHSKCHDGWYDGRKWEPWMDHYWYAKRGRVSAAIITEPYHDIPRIEGLQTHMPPNKFASFWFPGWTIFCVITRPGEVIKWLPEQLEWEMPNDRNPDKE